MENPQCTFECKCDILLAVGTFGGWLAALCCFEKSHITVMTVRLLLKLTHAANWHSSYVTETV